MDTIDPRLGQPSLGAVGYDARSILGESRHGATWRTFLSRLQLVLLVAFAATLLFAMGLGMGALVLSLPRQGPFGQLASSAGEGTPIAAAPESVPAMKPAERPGTVELPTMTSGRPVERKDHKAPKALPVPVTPAPVQEALKTAPASATPAIPATPEPAATLKTAPAIPPTPAPAEAGKTAQVPATAQSNTAQSNTAQSNTAQSNTAPANTAPANDAAVPAAPPTAPAGGPVESPASSSAEGEFALQVGACSSYACVEQFRNLLLSEVDSSVIQVVSADNGAQKIQRIRVEPLTRDAGEKLKEALTAKDARFAQAYLIARH